MSKMANERSTVLLLCSLVLVAVAIVSWSTTSQRTVLVSRSQIDKEQTELEAVENQMMGDTPQSALAASQKAAKLQAVITSQKAMLKAQTQILKPARVQQLSYQPRVFAQMPRPVMHMANPLQLAAEKPYGVNVTPQAAQAGAAQAAQLAKNLARAQQKQKQTVSRVVAPSKQAVELAKHLHAAKQATKPIKVLSHPRAKAGTRKTYKPHTNSPWDTTVPSVPLGARAAGPVPAVAGAAPKPPPGYVTVKTLLPGQKLPPGAVELPSNFMNKLAKQGNFVPKSA